MHTKPGVSMKFIERWNLMSWLDVHNPWLRSEVVIAPAPAKYSFACKWRGSTGISLFHNRHNMINMPIFGMPKPKALLTIDWAMMWTTVVERSKSHLITVNNANFSNPNGSIQSNLRMTCCSFFVTLVITSWLKHFGTLTVSQTSSLSCDLRSCMSYEWHV